MDFLNTVVKCDTQEAARDLFERLSTDTEYLNEVASHCALAPDNVKLAFNNLRRKVGHGYRKDVDDLRKIVENQAEAKSTSILNAQDTPSIHASFDVLPSERFITADQCKMLHVPFGYKLCDSGVYKLKVENDETVETLILSDPIFISSTTLDNQTRDRHILLLYKDIDDCWREIECTLEDIGSNQKLMQLARKGLQVNQNNAPAMVRFLSKFYDLNRRAIPNLLITRKMGWHEVRGETVFVWPDMTVGIGNQKDSIVFRALEGNHTHARAFRKRGELIDAARILDKVKELPVPIFSVWHGLAGFLLHFLKPQRVHGSTLDIGAPPGTGKSTCGYFYTWLVGRPGFEEDAAGMDWNATANLVEIKAGFYHSVPFFIDETKLEFARSGKNFGVRNITRWVYAHYNGEGKGGATRTRGVRRKDSWLTNCGISGESTFTSLVRDNEGARARMIPIEDLPFGENSEETKELITHLNEVMLENYGILGRKFVELLLQLNAKKPDVIPRLYKANKERAQALAAGNSTGTRVAEYIAAAVTAGDLMYDYLKMPRPSADMWLFIERVMKNVNHQANRGDIALRQMVEHFQSNPSNVINLGAVENSVLWAAWPNSKRPYLLVTERALEKFFADYGHSKRTVLDAWFKSGYVKISGNQIDLSKRTFSSLVSSAKTRVRYNVGNASRTLSGYAIKQEYITQLLAMSYMERGSDMSEDAPIPQAKTAPEPSKDDLMDVPW